LYTILIPQVKKDRKPKPLSQQSFRGLAALVFIHLSK
jgi:hypothetical protein